jgi:hypothetical protein
MQGSISTVGDVQSIIQFMTFQYNALDSFCNNIEENKGRIVACFYTANHPTSYFCSVCKKIMFLQMLTEYQHSFAFHLT